MKKTYDPTGGPNGIAKDLRTPKYRTKVVKSRKVYSRKGRKEKGSFDGSPVSIRILRFG